MLIGAKTDNDDTDDIEPFFLDGTLCRIQVVRRGEMVTPCNKNGRDNLCEFHYYLNSDAEERTSLQRGAHRTLKAIADERIGRRARSKRNIAIQNRHLIRYQQLMARLTRAHRNTQHAPILTANGMMGLTHDKNKNDIFSSGSRRNQ